jgi:hypothetical protein
MPDSGSVDRATGYDRYARSELREQEECCPHCGRTTQVEGVEAVLKRGAVVVAYDPTIVTWRGRIVPLSPTEAHVYAHLARRGRATIAEIDDQLLAFGSNPATRSLVVGHIRGKFRKMGACDPFERIGAHAFRLRVDPDEKGLAAPVIGLRLPRYATLSK